ncbi:MAG: type II toxin-antitoxin system RelE/ParE family toxin [Limisphaerales bacterium]
MKASLSSAICRRWRNSFIATILLPRDYFLKRLTTPLNFSPAIPDVGRQRDDLGFPEIRSWRVEGFRRYLIFYRELPDRIQIWRVLHGARDLHQTLGEQ